MQSIFTLLKSWKRTQAAEGRRKAQAAHATVYVTRDGRGRVMSAR
ncbi:MAG: hypothetical protein ACYDHN_06570 [Solirubrobacteraceae bacterium]